MPELDLYRRIASGRAIRMVAFGASSTQRFMCGMHWFDYVELGFKNDYTHKVGQFINSGVSNDSTGELLARFDAECALYQPDLVLLTVGANDCRLRRSQPEFEANLLRLIAQIRALGSEVVLQTFYPIDVENSRGNWPDLDDYVATVRQVAAAEAVPLVDTACRWRPLRDAHPERFRTLLRDYAHLNERGNQLLGLDLMRFFGVGLKAKDGQFDYCHEGIVLQALVDSLHRGQDAL